MNPLISVVLMLDVRGALAIVARGVNEHPKLGCDTRAKYAEIPCCEPHVSTSLVIVSVMLSASEVVNRPDHSCQTQCD